MTADRRVVTLGQVLQILPFSLQQSLLHLSLVVDVSMECAASGVAMEMK